MTGQTPMEGPQGPPSALGPPRGFVRRLLHEERDAWRKHYGDYFKYAARALGLGFVIGFLYFTFRPGQEKKALEFVVGALEDIRLEGSPLALALTLFYHNARASVIAVAAGAVPFLFLPILDPFINGAVLGLIVSVTKHRGFDVPRLILTQILPHGVFELAAVLYATSVGLHLSAGMGKRAAAAWDRRRDRPKPEPPGGTLSSPLPPDVLEAPANRAAAEPAGLARNVVRSFFLVVLPLLLIAAFIEGFITPSLR